MSGQGTRAPFALRLVLALHPRRFRDRFAVEIAALYAELGLRDRAAARRLLFDLACNSFGTRLDELRLGRARDLAIARSHPGRPPRTRRQEDVMFDSLSSDSKFALRRFVRVPAVTAVAILTLALGIGGTTAIFSVVNGVLLHPLSAPEPERLLFVTEASATSQGMGLSYETFKDYRAGASSLAHLALVRPQSVSVTGGTEAPERIRGLFVTASFFDVLAEAPVLGRALAPGEDVPGGERAAVISHGYWQRRFGARPEVLGETLKFNNEIHTIVGVMGPEFRFPMDTTEAWISLQTVPGSFDRQSRNFMAIGRLAPGISAAEADQELDTIAQGLAEAHPETQRGVSVDVVPLVESLSGPEQRQLFAVLGAAVCLVLLIAAANVANLQLAQATARHREMALRAAVGARQRRLLGQLLIESLLLALAGGAVGVAVAFGGVELLTRLGPSWLGQLYAIEPDPTVLLFALGVSVLTGLAFGLVPARRAARVDLTEGLKEGAKSSSRQGGRLRSGLVVVQLAVAVVLVVGAGLLARSVENLDRVEVGFDTRNLLTVQFRLPQNKYAEDQQVVGFFDEMLAKVAAVPGVTGVASAYGMPFTGDEGQVQVLADGVDPGPDATLPLLRANVVSPNYFAVMGIPLATGRVFDDGDRAGTPLVAVLSEKAAETIFKGEPALGRTFTTREDDAVATVIGIVGDVYNRGLRQGVDPMVYVNYRQRPAIFATIAARTVPAPHALSQAIRDAIWEVDAEQPLWEVMTQEERIAFWTGSDRFITSLIMVFAAVALLLAAVGIGGVIAYSISLRRRELGVRMSLGANRKQIVQLVLGQCLRLLVPGVALGLLGAVALKNTLATWLFGVAALDPGTFAAASLTLALVALAATAGSAWRAAWLDPVTALRED